MSDKRFRDDDGKLDLGKIERYEDSSYKIVLLLKYIEEQQATITELKEENEKLKKEKYNLIKMVTNGIRISYTGYIQLEKENEQLRKELDNFKPVMFQDMRKGTVILYSKGD